MIINTGQRTDIPAFYSAWLVNRLKAGFAMVRNPYNPQIVTRYRLTPDVVDLIAFCTKNPEPMIKYMDLLEPFGQHWYVTITPYGRDIEPNVPSKKAVMESFRRLSKIVGVRRVGWRFDPIFIDESWTVERHIRAFEYIAEALEGYTDNAVISFIDLYDKTKRNFSSVRAVTRGERLTLGGEMAGIAKRHGMTLRPCAEGDELSGFGADTSGCMTIAMYERALGRRLRPPSFTPARKVCACYLGADIGAYNTCGHLCRYCYANYDRADVAANMRRHDPSSPLLIGQIGPDDIVHEADQSSWIDPQITAEDLLRGGS